MKPLFVDLFCGLGGFTEGGLAAGYECVGFDIEVHDYGDGARYPAQLVLQDVLTIHGRQFKDAALIVASPPCQEYSWMAMPWSKAKAHQRKIEADTTGQERKRLTALFDACFRIQREACEAAGRRIPIIIENVRGAQKWVGRSAWNFGSFHLWGDVPALMPSEQKFKTHGMNWSNQELRGQDFTRIAAKYRTTDPDIGPIGPGHVCKHGIRWPHACQPCADANFKWSESDAGQKTTGCANKRYGHSHTRHLTNQSESDGLKLGGSWFHEYRKGQGPRNHGSKSKARKAASAAIAKIPFVLAHHIAQVWKPREAQCA